VFLHQFGEHFVFPAQFCFKLLNALYFYALLTAGITNEGDGTVFKELLLPVIENRWLKLVLVTQIG